MAKFKIATFNIHHGKQPDVPYSTKRLCEDVASLNCDVICMQEVDAYSLRTHFVNQSKIIAKHLGFHYRTEFVRFYGIGFQHNTILSRFPILNYEQLTLPSVDKAQRRIAQLVTLEFESKKIDIINCHLHSGYNNSDGNIAAQNQLKFLTKKYSEGNFILAGDLNLTSEYVTAIATEADLQTISGFLTSPASNPKQQIDWILTRGFEIESMKVSPQLCSDHRALIADVNIS